MSERNEGEWQAQQERPGTGSAGDGGVMEAGGTLGGVTATEDGQIVREVPDGRRVATPGPGEGVAAGSDLDLDAGPAADEGIVHGYEDLESDPGV